MAVARENETNQDEKRELNHSNTEDVEMKEVAPEVTSTNNGTETKTEESNTEKDSVSQPATNTALVEQVEVKDYDVREVYGASCRFLGQEFNQISSQALFSLRNLQESVTFKKSLGEGKEY